MAGRPRGLCQQFGIVLPDPGSAKDSPVTWTYNDPDVVTTEGPSQGTIDEAGDATLQCTTLTESQEGGPVVPG